MIKRLDDSRWRALVRPAKKLKLGERIRFGERSESTACLLGALDAEVEEKGEDGEVTLAFAFAGAALDEAIERLGAPPLPPYIASRRPVRPADRADYQTLFARESGAVAAPTAGLHFTPALLSRSRGEGGEPPSRDAARRRRHFPAGQGRRHKRSPHARRMGAPRRRRPPRRSTRRGGAADASSRSAPPRLRLSKARPTKRGAIRPFEGETAIFIAPGYRFRAVDALLTNFHLPRSTLFMLVSAFSGLETMRRAYAHAIAAGYRFYSYGDACLLIGADRRGDI